MAALEELAELESAPASAPGPSGGEPCPISAPAPLHPKAAPVIPIPIPRSQFIVIFLISG
jgi:hypothetical protein